MRSKGFTLIELLLAMTLLTILIATSTLAHRFYIQQWQRLSTSDTSVAKQAIQMQELSRVLGSTANYLIQPELNQFGYYWKGSRYQFIGVTQSSLYQPQQSAVYEVSFIDQDTSCILAYREQSLSLNLPTNFEFSMPASTPVVNISLPGSCSGVEYFGWTQGFEDGGEGETLFFPLSKARWFNEYNGITNRSLPFALRINLRTIDGELSSHHFSLTSTLIERFAYAGGSSE